jgi:hypothetical protein
MSERLSREIAARLPSGTTIVSSLQEFATARRDEKTISFLDDSTLAELGTQAPPPGPVVAICPHPLQTAIGWLPSHPWLSHVLSAGMLDHPMAAEHLGNVTSTLTSSGNLRLLDWVGPTMSARRVRLARSSRRADRLERMTTFFDTKGVGSRTIQLLRDAAEELLTNAFYDAPVAAGALDQPISRTQDVSLSDESACDMVYGCREDLAIVRVRDPFGSLSRTRLVEVLTRCARTDMRVEVDETMGGAGLGLWRIFSAASFVAISVVNNRHTEFLVGIGKRVPAAPRPFAFHLFFKDRGRAARRWRLLDADSSKPMSNKAVTIVTK